MPKHRKRASKKIIQLHDVFVYTVPPDNMKDLYNRLAFLKIILNSSYGSNTVANVYEESYRIRKKIDTIKVRKQKIKNLFND